ncbi:MAG TPA: ABC transporter permease, partial [Vicinamibacterales bacterium]|nr:ABC transporter permease [Vicinamibacterales bacterium]
YRLVGDGEPERLIGVGVTQTFLDLLGVQPVLGRGFADEECVWNGRRALILTNGFWERRYGADPGVVGRSILLDGAPTTIVGVLPATFDFASIFVPASRIDFLTPFPVSDETDGWGNTLAVIGRLKPGLTVAKAQADLDLINRQLQQAQPKRGGLGAAVTPLADQIRGRVRRALLVLAGAVSLVLLVACANLANLLLARGAVRRKEVAVRSALGATRSRLVRQMLSESVVLAFCGAGLGLLVAFAATRAITSTQALSIPLLRSVEIDGAAFFFTVAAALATGLLFGSVPAWQLSRADDQEALRDSDRGSSEGRSGAWMRRGLVVAEVALTLMLLVGAGLLLRSFATLLDVDLGFRPEQTAAWRIDPGQQYRDRQQRLAFYQRVTETVAALPGIDSVGLTDTLPLGRNRSWSIHARGDTRPSNQWPDAFPRIVNAGYLRTMRIPFIAGRDFTVQDTADRETVLIVNETLARTLWPGMDPIGRIVVIGRVELRVVGVVGDVRHSTLEEAAGLEMYLPVYQADAAAVELVVRSHGEIESLVPSVRAALRSIDPSLPTDDFRTLGQIVDRALSPRRFILQLLGAFALVALLLSALGIYGVISHAVSQRAPEIGIRMALGASPGRVQLGVMATTLSLALAGIVIGLFGSFVFSRLMASLLYGVTATDLLTFAAVTIGLAAIAGMAGYVPARRASRIDPISVLRSA